MDFGAAALIGALVYSVINFLKYVRARDVNAAGTQLCVWVAGVGVVFLASTAAVTNQFVFNGTALVHMDTGSKIIIGLMASSLFATVPHDLKKAFDNSDSAATPPLIRSTKPPAT